MKYKGYELMKAVAEGKLNLKQKVSSTSLEYKNCTIEFVLKDKAFNIMDLDFELIEDKIKEGEYIRSKAGCVDKITRIDENGNCYLDYYGDFSGLNKYQLVDITKKHSKNIIDIVKPGDFVNGHLVVGVEQNIDKPNFVITENAAIYYSNEKIKSILTHEMYEKNCYKMEEEE